jgi:hypothetical protein
MKQLNAARRSSSTFSLPFSADSEEMRKKVLDEIAVEGIFWRQK